MCKPTNNDDGSTTAKLAVGNVRPPAEDDGRDAKDDDDDVLGGDLKQKLVSDAKDDDGPPSNEDEASCLSSWLLLYVSPLLRLGAIKVLEPEDVGPPSKCDRARLCHEAVRKLWTLEVAHVRDVNERDELAHDARIAKLPMNATTKRRGRTYQPKNPRWPWSYGMPLGTGGYGTPWPCTY